jgi:hypothetical protein
LSQKNGRQDARAILGLAPADLAHAPGQIIVRDSA